MLIMLMEIHFSRRRVMQWQSAYILMAFTEKLFNMIDKVWEHFPLNFQWNNREMPEKETTDTK